MSGMELKGMPMSMSIDIDAGVEVDVDTDIKYSKDIVKHSNA